jgi:hypothetical protein
VGGFGNNLFQIALSKRIESLGYKVKFDLSSKKRIRLELKDIPELNDYFSQRVASWTLFFPSPIGNQSKLSAGILKYILGLKLHIDLRSEGKEPEDLSGRRFLTGYWQTLENAKHLGSFNFFNQSEIKGTIGIHVRRGDMILNINNPLDGFFRKSIQLIQEQNPNQDFKISVITDDASYCSEILQLGTDFTVIYGGTTLEDFLSLISNEYLILSRSTFSWWAGYLSKGNIFYPIPWNLDKNVNDSSIIPSHWVGVTTDNL